MRHTTKLGAAVLASAALIAAGCGSSDDKSSSDSAPTTPAAGNDTSAAATNTAISMKDIQFDPKEDAVKVGQTVTWTNDDSVDHNVTATSGADFKSSDFGQGGTYKFK